MPFKYIAHEGNLLLSFDGALTIFQAAERKPELLHALSLMQREVTLDLSGVDEIDTAGLQLLLLLRREIARQGGILHVTACSPAVMAVLDLLQLHALLGSDAALAAECPA